MSTDIEALRARIAELEADSQTALELADIADEVFRGMEREAAAVRAARDALVLELADVRRGFSVDGEAEDEYRDALVLARQFEDNKSGNWAAIVRRAIGPSPGYHRDHAALTQEVKRLTLELAVYQRGLAHACAALSADRDEDAVAIIADLARHLTASHPEMLHVAQMEAEVKHLRGEIEGAPHDSECPHFGWVVCLIKLPPCACWKGRALQGEV